MIKVSVIIPIYNGETYLRECLDSVCNQSLKEIEIICVDDGSTDQSTQIVKEYMDTDQRVHLFQQQNKYAGAARNLGKKNAQGEYLIFWDCDDFFELEALEQMYEKASNMKADICVCGANQYLQDLNKVTPYGGYLNKKRITDFDVFNRTSNTEFILNFTNEAAWNKMYRRAFVEKLGLDFQTVRNGNDVYFTVVAMCLADRITTVAQPFINYRKNQKQSLVGTLSKSPLTPFYAWADAADKLIQLDAFPERSFANKVVASLVYLLRNIQKKDSFDQTVNFLKQEGLRKLHLFVQEEGYYYNEWYNSVIEHLTNDSIEDFQMFLSFSTYIQLTESAATKRLNGAKTKVLKSEIKTLKSEIKELKKENKALTVRIEKIRNSWSFKIGKAISWFPRKMKQLLKRKE